MNKRGQIFILAAVIIVVVVISLAAVQNYVRVDKEPNEFYDLSDNIGQESDMVIAHDIYNNDDTIEDYALIAQAYARDNEVDTLLIYGNSTHLVIENYLNSDIDVGEGSIPGCGESSFNYVSDGSVEKKLQLDLNDFKVSCRKIISRQGIGNKISIKYGEEIINFNLNKDDNFIVLLKKEDDSGSSTVVNQNENVL